MHDESTELMKTLTWVVDLIMTADARMLQRIAESHAEAQAHVAGIPFDDWSARPRIVACLEHWNVYKAKDDLGGAGWVLTAVQERIAERDLRAWPDMKAITDQAAAVLRERKWLGAHRQVH